MISKATLLVNIVLCASLLGAQGVSADGGSGGDVFRLYETDIHARVDGVYESGEWVFFHCRSKMSGSDRFAKLATMKASWEKIAKEVFAWIDSHGGSRVNQIPSSLEAMRQNGLKFASGEAVVKRSLSNLPSRVLHRDVDTSKPEEYVLDLCIRKSDLLAEAQRGRFDTRKEVVVKQWGNVVQEQLASTNQMAFLRVVGAFDLWTINSEFTSGLNALQMSNGMESTYCAKCIAELMRCTEQVGSEAAKEYGKFLGDFQKNIAAEFQTLGDSNKYLRVRIILDSYASCLVTRQDFPDSAAEVIGKYAGQTESAKDTIRAILPVLEKAPGTADGWQIVGEAALRGELYHLALVSFRNQLRLGDRSPELFDHMANAYGKLGCHELAKGAAMIAYGLISDVKAIPEACRILGLK